MLGFKTQDEQSREKFACGWVRKTKSPPERSGRALVLTKKLAVPVRPASTTVRAPAASTVRASAASTTSAAATTAVASATTATAVTRSGVRV